MSVLTQNIGGPSAATSDFVTLRLAGQLVGIPVLSVHDVLGPQKITHIPLAPKAVAGVLNLRGRIVTAIDLRRRLDLPPREANEKGMAIVVEHRGEPYSLLIDQVGEVVSIGEDKFEKNPVTLKAHWREVSDGVYRLDQEIMVVLNVERLLGFTAAVAA